MCRLKKTEKIPDNDDNTRVSICVRVRISFVSTETKKNKSQWIYRENVKDRWSSIFFCRLFLLTIRKRQFKWHIIIWTMWTTIKANFFVRFFACVKLCLNLTKIKQKIRKCWTGRYVSWQSSTPYYKYFIYCVVLLSVNVISLLYIHTHPVYDNAFCLMAL